MNRKIKLIVSTTILCCCITLLFTNCGCKHEWKDATCTDPKTCSLCGETEGVPLGHNWSSITCTSPKTCTRCGETVGEALGHDWIKATCTEPRTCDRCGEIDGEALGHDWVEATCTEPRICNRCGETEGEVFGHEWIEATCTKPRTCARCNMTEGEAIGHVVTEWSVSKPASCAETGIEIGICEICGEEQTKEISKLKHQFSDWKVTKKATCTEKGIEKRVCTNCKKEETREFARESHKLSNWEIIKEATYSDSGTRIRKCKVCGQEVKRETYSLSEEEKITWLKKNSKSNLYQDLARSPSQFKGQYVRFDCHILQIVSETKSEDQYSTYRAATKGSWDNAVYLCVDNYYNINDVYKVSNAVKRESTSRQDQLKKAFENGTLDNLNNNYHYISRKAADAAVASSKDYGIGAEVGGEQELFCFTMNSSGNYVGSVWEIYDIRAENTRILEGDKIRIYGLFDGLITYTTILGESITIPKIIVLYYE